MTDQLVLVDAHGLAYRSYYAYQTMRDADGRPTGMYYGFLRALLRLERQFGWPAVLCWDHYGGKVRNWRHAIYKDYKANRKAKPDLETLLTQIDNIQQLFREIGHPQVGAPGMEADDVIGILACTVQCDSVVIYTTDRDLYQLLDNDKVKIVHPSEGSFAVITRQDVEKTYQIPIYRWAAFLAFGGDTADHIKPIPGVGLETALRMVRAGGRPDLPFADQPEEFRRKFAGAEPYWDQVQAAYQVACIPRSFDDPRIRHLVKRWKADWPLHVDPDRAMKHFMAFCADHNLVDLLYYRREFVHAANQGPAQLGACLSYSL
jgi:5'-3' exonuclease